MGYIDKTGRIAIALQFVVAERFSEGRARVVKEDSDGYGFIDKEGRIVIEPQFTWAGHFFGGLANVMVDDKKGYIDRSGNYVWRPTK
ncbi:MAG TPA: WG repeat-containing protein [Blastocatellia bacterium]|nr:WG repeat-containing protein [Blastocatellia bacterium]